MNNNYVDLPVPIIMPSFYEPLTWAKKHCASYITNDAVQKNGVYYYRFYFSKEEDQVMFALRWS